MTISTTVVQNSSPIPQGIKRGPPNGHYLCLTKVSDGTVYTVVRRAGLSDVTSVYRTQHKSYHSGKYHVTEPRPRHGLAVPLQGVGLSKGGFGEVYTPGASLRLN